MPSLLVVILAGNPVTAIACLNMKDATTLRRLHPAVAAAVEGVPWNEESTTVKDVVRWRAALPGAVGAALWRLAGASTVAGVTSLDLTECGDVSGPTLMSLPPSLRAVKVITGRAGNLVHLKKLTSLACSHMAAKVWCYPPSLQELRIDCCRLKEPADFSHLRVLRKLSLTATKYIPPRTIATLPPSLEELDLSETGPEWYWHADASLARLTRLRVFRAVSGPLYDAMLASLPPSLVELHAADSTRLTPAASFAHLPALRTLDVTDCGIGDTSLASLPPSLVELTAARCKNITSAAMLPHLPALRALDVSGSGVGDVFVASLPAALQDLCIVDCAGITAGATFDHLPALRELQSSGTDLSAATLAACHARGCTAPAKQEYLWRRKSTGDTLRWSPGERP